MSELDKLRPEQLRMSKVENVMVPPGQGYDLFVDSGPGEVESLWMAVAGGNYPTLDGRIRVYYAGVKHVDIDLGTLLVTHWGASGAFKCEHISVEYNGALGFLFTFPMPYGTSGIRIEYYNINRGQNAHIYSMVAYRKLAVDRGMRLRCQGARFDDQRVTRGPGSDVQLAATPAGSSGSIVYHSMVGGVGATNLSWLERNIAIWVNQDPGPTIVASGTEDWYDSAWYFGGRKNYSPSMHTMIGTFQYQYAQNACGMATDFLSKWGGIPFDNGFMLRVQTEPACTTGDEFCWAVLYYENV